MDERYKYMSLDGIADQDRRNAEAERHDNGCAVTVMLFMIVGMLGMEFPIIWLGVFVVLAIISVRRMCRWLKNQ